MEETTSVEYTIYKNVFKYLDGVGYEPCEDAVHTKSQFLKTMQFHSVVVIKTKIKDTKISKDTSGSDMKYVFIVKEPSFVQTTKFSQLISTIRHPNARVMIISETGIAKNVLAKHRKKMGHTTHIENRLYDHFKLCPQSHILTPKQTLVTDEAEKKKIAKDFAIKNPGRTMSLISCTDDPVAIWLGAKQGDFVISHRRDKNGPSLYPRIAMPFIKRRKK